MIISIEREMNTLTPGKSPRYRARIRATEEGHAILISASNFGSVAAAKDAMGHFFGRAIVWVESNEEPVRAVGTVEI